MKLAFPGTDIRDVAYPHQIRGGGRGVARQMIRRYGLLVIALRCFWNKPTTTTNKPGSLHQPSNPFASMPQTPFSTLPEPLHCRSNAGGWQGFQR